MVKQTSLFLPAHRQISITHYCTWDTRGVFLHVPYQTEEIPFLYLVRCSDHIIVFDIFEISFPHLLKLIILFSNFLVHYIRVVDTWN